MWLLENGTNPLRSRRHVDSLQLGPIVWVDWAMNSSAVSIWSAIHLPPQNMYLFNTVQHSMCCSRLLKKEICLTASIIVITLFCWKLSKRWKYFQNKYSQLFSEYHNSTDCEVECTATQYFKRIRGCNKYPPCCPWARMNVYQLQCWINAHIHLWRVHSEGNRTEDLHMEICMELLDFTLTSNTSSNVGPKVQIYLMHLIFKLSKH